MSEPHVPPIVVNFLIECHCSARPGTNIWPGGWESPAGTLTRQYLQAENLVDEEYRLTARGKDWLDAILSVPIPSPPEG